MCVGGGGANMIRFGRFVGNIVCVRCVRLGVASKRWQSNSPAELLLVFGGHANPIKRMAEKS